MAKRSTGPELRPEQAAIMEYDGGEVGIAAVPGSGKTFTLAHLAARLVAQQGLKPDQEVLVVTFTNSAVNSFQARIARILEEQHGLLPNVGYRVRTLHGLAHDIVRERPALVGLAEDFVILDERTARDVQTQIVTNLLSEWWGRLAAYLAPDVKEARGRHQFEQHFPDLAVNFIKRAKDRRQTPESLRARLEDAGDVFDLARFAVQVYAEYQRSLLYRGAVDFDDLVRLALEALTMDASYLARLQTRWPYILEDEAQDSSFLQEEMLRLLSREQNWVRVGDPNQAINTTFTTANPRFLLDFLDTEYNPDVAEYPLSVSGRSAEPIIALANELVRWTVEEHPVPDLRDAFTQAVSAQVRRGHIQPTPPGDPQTNPPAEDAVVHIEYRVDQKITPEREIELVVSSEEYSIIPWLDSLPENERPTVAVLVPENQRGFRVAEALRREGVPYEELLRSTTATRAAVGLLRTLLDYLSESTDLQRLKRLFWELMPEAQREIVNGDVELRQTMTDLFAEFRNIEDFLWPEEPPQFDDLPDEYQWLGTALLDFRQLVRRWLEAIGLPVDQLVLTVAQDIFQEPVDVALAHKVAVLLRSMAESHPDWRLPEFVEELKAISTNQRRFAGFDASDSGYEPQPGVVTVATLHMAKGLEWDRVYLMAASNYGFPSALSYDPFIGERWYVRAPESAAVEHLNLEAEVLAQLDALIVDRPERYAEGDATLAARLDYARERLRLLYVGITRARRELFVTWNMGRFWQRGQENQVALPVAHLSTYLEM